MLRIARKNIRTNKTVRRVRRDEKNNIIQRWGFSDRFFSSKRKEISCPRNYSKITREESEREESEREESEREESEREESEREESEREESETLENILDDVYRDYEEMRREELQQIDLEVAYNEYEKIREEWVIVSL
jgi:hypothetical protein